MKKVIVFRRLAGEKPEARYGVCDTPAGRCLIAVAGCGVCWLSFHRAWEAEKGIAELSAFWGRDKLIPDANHAQGVIDRIFSKDRSAERPVEVLVGGTPFQFRQWETLTEIPFGETVTYAEVARRSGFPKAVRAAGTAIGRNNVSFLIPCHRVVRSDGQIGRYRWGAEVKRRLLLWERE